MKTVSVDTGDGPVRVGGRSADAKDVELRRLAAALPLTQFVDVLPEAAT